MNLLQLKEEWLKEENAYFEGWDFSHLKDRWIDEQIPWDYKKIIQKYLNENDRLLDMGTGGGEFLLSLKHPLSFCSVSEGYEPNVIKCEKELIPLGVRVKKIISNEIPYEDNSFNIIINRHADYDLSEVKRVLKEDGIFITQQIGDKNDEDLILKMHLKRETVTFDTRDLTAASQYAKRIGFHFLEGYESFTPIKFYDIGAFVYFARIISWEFVNFSVKANFKELCALQKEVEEKGYLEGSEHRYLMVLKK